MLRRLRVAACLLSVLIILATASQVSSPVHAAGTHAYDGKRITINLVRERLRAWEGKKLILVTPVTTGNATLPTPTGWFTIFAKRSPFTFISPWPKGSSKWYPTSTVSFAMEFLNGGYFIHDAPWRGVYGKGTNKGSQPGTDYGGTHGCVNVPYNVARFLYFWAPIGTSVHIVR